LGKNFPSFSKIARKCEKILQLAKLLAPPVFSEQRNLIVKARLTEALAGA
jgi:hypothetical protein